MNPEKLKKLQMQVRIGGKGTPRRKKKIVHATAATDDKKLQSSLKKLSVNTIPGIEEVNMIKDDGTVIHFNNPKAQASLAANTFAINGHGEHKQITEMLPGILTQLGPEGLNQLKRLANNVVAGNKLLSVNEEDDVPTVDNFEEVAKKEIEQTAAKKSPFEDMDGISAEAFAQAVAALAMPGGTGAVDDVIKEVEASTKLATPSTAAAPTGEKKDEPAKKEGTPKKGDEKKKDNKKNENKKNENKKAEGNTPKKSDAKKENQQASGKKEAAAKKGEDKPKEKSKEAAPQATKKGGSDNTKKPDSGAAPKKDDKPKESAKKQQQESKKTNEAAKKQASDSKKTDAAVASKKSDDVAPATPKPSA